MVKYTLSGHQKDSNSFIVCFNTQLFYVNMYSNVPVVSVTLYNNMTCNVYLLTIGFLWCLSGEITPLDT